MKRIAFINQKGGCGKSTSLFHIAGDLATRGFKVLVIDTDKQLDTTNNFLAEEESEYDPTTAKTILDYLRGTPLADIIKKNYIRVGNFKPAYKGIDVIPSDPQLDNQNLVSQIVADTESIESFFDSLDYDYILIDCPPSNTAVEELVLGHIATDVVTPLTCDVNAVRGSGTLQRRIDDLRRLNPTLNLCGVFFSMARKNTAKYKEYRKALEQSFGQLAFKTDLPCSSDIVVSLEDKGQPLAYYHKCKAKDCMKEFVDELLERL